MPTPVRSGASSPVHNDPAEEAGTVASAAASPTPSARERAIPEFMQPLLRNRSPVRDVQHAQRRWEELPRQHVPQSIAEADRLMHGFTTSFHLPEDHPLRIDHETYRLLLGRLQAIAENLPPVRPSARAQQLTHFAGLIHSMDHADHLGAFATVLKAVGEELPHDQQGVPLAVLVAESGKLSGDLQTLLRSGLFETITRLPAEHRHKPMQAFAGRLGESASDIRLPENADDLEPFPSMLREIELLPDRYRSEPLTRLVTAIGRQPTQHHAALMTMVEASIKRLPAARRHGPLQAFADLLD